MGVKQRIEQSIKRARREGRLEDAADFEQDLIALKAQRSQAAMERGRSYTVQPGESYFSIAADQMGDERWAKTLVQANPDLLHLKPGMIIVIPRPRGETPSFDEQEYHAFVDKYDMEPDVLGAELAPGQEQSSAGAEAESATEPMQPEEAEQPALPPGAMSAEEEDALVDDLVVLFRALGQQGAVVLPEKKATSLPKQKASGQKVAARKPVQTPPPPTGTPEPEATETLSPKEGTAVPDSMSTESPRETEVNDYQSFLDDETSAINERLIQIIEETGQNRLNTLVIFFTDPTIEDLSLTLLARDRLNLLLELTSKNSIPLTKIQTQFGIVALDGDQGFGPRLQDQDFYRTYWEKDENYLSPQIGHFLTAVNLADLESGDLGIRLTIGHEKFSDDEKGEDLISRFTELAAASDADVAMFQQAIEQYKAGNIKQSDELLWDILDMHKTTPFGGIEKERVGNSLQDLRLSLVGYVFNDWLDDNPNASAAEAANWLNENLGGND